MVLKSPISQNIANLFRVDFFCFPSSESSLLKFFNLEARNLHSQKYKKSVSWKNIRTFLFLVPEFSNFKNIIFFFLKNMRNVLERTFFYFLISDWKSRQVCIFTDGLFCKISKQFLVVYYFLKKSFTMDVWQLTK